MAKKPKTPPYLALMMLNPCEVMAVKEEDNSLPDTDDHESTSSENEPLVPSRIPRVYDQGILSPKGRLSLKSTVILMIYFLLTISINSSWCLFASVSTAVQAYFNVSAVAANLLSMTYPLMFVLAGSFAQRLLHSYSPSVLMLLAAFIHALGAAIRCKGTDRDGYLVLLIGQMVCGLAAAPSLCLAYSLHILCENLNLHGLFDIFVIATNIFGVGIGFFCSSRIITETKDMNTVGWDIYYYTLWLAVVAVFILILVPFTLKGLSLSLQLDEYDPASSSKMIKRDQLEQHVFSVSQVVSRINFRYVLQNRPIQLLANAFGLCFADAYIYMLLLENILHEKIVFKIATKTGLIGFISLICGFIFGVGLRTICRHRSSAVKHTLLFLVCLSAVFDLMFIILHRFHMKELSVFIFYCISQSSSISALIIYVDYIPSIKTIPIGTSTFVLLFYASSYGLVAGILGSVFLSIFGETTMLAVTEVASLGAILLTYFFPTLQHKKGNNINRRQPGKDGRRLLSRRDSIEGNFV